MEAMLVTVLVRRTETSEVASVAAELGAWN